MSFKERAMESSSKSFGLAGQGPRSLDRIRSTALEGVAAEILRHGGDPDRIFSRFNLYQADRTAPDDYVSYRSVILLLEHCAEVFERQHFALEVSQHQTPAIFGPIAVLLEAASCAREALEYLVRYFFIQTPLAWVKITDMDGEDEPITEIRFLSMAQGLSYKRQVNEQGLSLIFKVLCMLLGERAPLSYIRIAARAPEGPLMQIHRTFGSEVLYNQDVNAIAVPSRVLARPLSRHDDWLAHIVTEQLDRLRMRDDIDLVERVDRLLLELLPLGRGNLPTCARQLGVSVRTLQVHLRMQGQDFSSILANRRKILAEEYLMQTELPLSDIAMLLGYADQATFTRAFTTLVGLPPSRFRKATRSSLE